MPFRVEYAPDAEGHLKLLTARQRSLVMDAVEKQLSHDALVETRNRKPMRPNPLAPWELRIGNLRVYYDILKGDLPLVLILAVGVKRRNRIYIGKEEIQL